jgi:hypothetical protein
MLRIHFTLRDLARVTISARSDPLWEILFSGFRLQERHRAVIYRPWLAMLGARSGHVVTPIRAGRTVLEVLAPRARTSRTSSPRRRAGTVWTTVWTRSAGPARCQPTSRPTTC